ncbi:hypothetical protein DY000_02028316 [Brassica cretica]|uniref:Meiosis-specific protein ASY3-like coiled-coil domain-containing protein n=1 Tax=Brassica cretica TaxID=69181 RepID=A0ABQ7DS44_BRACR|nr:hypothetical protein DY000_02028316 [Brassica cretica]
MSEYRSFGSNFHPSSQSRKMSIGVMVVDSQPKRNPTPDTVDVDVVARAEMLKSTTVAELQPSNKVKCEHATSPWRSSYRKLGTLENVLYRQTSGSKGFNKGPNGAAHQAPARDSFQNIPISSPRHSDDEPIGGRNGEEIDKSPQRMQEPPSAVLPQKVASQREEKRGPEKANDGSTDVLRSKLWEILGKASPENNEDVNSETPEVVKTNSKLNQDKSPNDDPLTKPRHHSDTIETDSESPEVATRRPVTRSLLQRRIQIPVNSPAIKELGISHFNPRELWFESNTVCGRRASIDLLGSDLIFFKLKMSEYRSFGSNYHPSSQSRKMSIGVMVVDSQPKRNPDGDDAIGRAEKLKSAAATDLQLNKKVTGDVAAKQRSSAKGTEHVTSPWSPQRSDDELIGGRNGEEIDKSPQRMQEPPSAVLPQKVASQREEKRGPEKANDGSTDVLRSKLWEILGKASPEYNEDVNSETPEVVKTNSKLNQDKSSDNDPLTKPRHNSDTIETDSESPEVATRRPVTRSLLQRRVGARGIQKRTKTGANLGGKSTEEVNNVFTFEEGLRGRNGTTVMPKKQRGRKKNTAVKCRKVQSREKDEADGILKETSKSKTPARSESTRTGKRSSLSDKKGSSLEFNQHTKAQNQKPDVRTREEDFQPSPEAETAATPEMFRGLFKNGDEQKGPSEVLREKSVEPENDFQSPTFGYKAPISIPSPCFSPEASPLHPQNISPAFDETETTIFSFGTKKTPQGTKGQASDKRLHDFLEKKGDYSFGRESSAEPDEDLVLSDPSSDEKDSDGSIEDSPALGHYNSPQAKETANGSNKKSKPGFSSAKRNSNLKGNGRVTSSLSEGMHKTDSFQRFSEVDEDEGLGRAVALFAVALQNFEKKLKAAAKKKSSEIIASVSEEIHLELENVKSHIITEAEKTSNVAKTKRKHAETRLQEQQEKMRMIHEKFKDDVGHHLEDFKSTIEGLEANHSELKGSIKKQRTSHQKLIAHFEGGIETKLDNATKRINSVNEASPCSSA